jgi:O-methyltransferase involved in polyketide biosynthesis
LRRNQARLNAIGIAMMRALESEPPEAERAICDLYARLFVPGWPYWTGRFFTAIGDADWSGPGVQGFPVARERYVDEHLAAPLGEEVRQLVSLRAGYDTRLSISGHPARHPGLRG